MEDDPSVERADFVLLLNDVSSSIGARARRLVSTVSLGLFASGSLRDVQAALEVRFGVYAYQARQDDDGC